MVLGTLYHLCFVFSNCLFSAVEMVEPEVDKELLKELEAMGFPVARATRALYYSGEVIE